MNVSGYEALINAGIVRYANIEESARGGVQLEEGDVLSAVVSEVKPDGLAEMKTADGQRFLAKMLTDRLLVPGQRVQLSVTSMRDGLPMVEITGENGFSAETFLKAMNAPQNETTLELAQEAIRQQAVFSPKQFAALTRQMPLFEGLEPEQAVFMARHNIPVNAENIARYKASGEPQAQLGALLQKLLALLPEGNTSQPKTTQPAPQASQLAEPTPQTAQQPQQAAPQTQQTVQQTQQITQPQTAAEPHAQQTPQPLITGAPQQPLSQPQQAAPQPPASAAEQTQPQSQTAAVRQTPQQPTAAQPQPAEQPQVARQPALNNPAQPQQAATVRQPVQQSAVQPQPDGVTAQTTTQQPAATPLQPQQILSAPQQAATEIPQMTQPEPNTAEGQPQSTAPQQPMEAPRQQQEPTVQQTPHQAMQTRQTTQPQQPVPQEPASQQTAPPAQSTATETLPLRQSVAAPPQEPAPQPQNTPQLQTEPQSQTAPQPQTEISGAAQQPSAAAQHQTAPQEPSAATPPPQETVNAAQAQPAVEATRQVPPQPAAAAVKPVVTILQQPEAQQAEISVEQADIPKLLDAIFAKVSPGRERELPRELDAPKLTREIGRLLERVLDSAREMPEQTRTEVVRAARDIVQNLRFSEQINHCASFAQLPVTINGERTTAQLYVFNDSREKKKIDPQNATMFISLATANLGQVEGFVKVIGTGVEADFSLQTEQSAQLFRAGLPELSASLEAQGYRLSRANAAVTAAQPSTPAAVEKERAAMAEKYRFNRTV